MGLSKEMIKQLLINATSDLKKYQISKDAEITNFGEDNFKIHIGLTSMFLAILQSNYDQTGDIATAIIFSVDAYCQEATRVEKSGMCNLIASRLGFKNNMPVSQSQERIFFEDAREDLVRRNDL